MPFTDESWETPESDLSAEEYCQVCLIDTNPAGQDKIKALCWLPVQKAPGGLFNRNALRNAAGRIFALEGVPADVKRRAAAHLIRLMREAGVQVGSQSLQRLAGER